MDSNIVYVGVRKSDFGGGALVGYFETKELPEGWKLCVPPEFDVSDIMESLQATKEEALEVMNRHWRGYR